MKPLILACGGLCTIFGAGLILLSDRIDGLLGFEIAIQLLGMLLLWMGLRKRKPAEAASPSPRQARLFLIGLVVILTLQFAYLVWWMKAGK